MNGKNRFTYTYTAPTEEERREIDSIRRSYLPKEEAGSLDRLRALDRMVRGRARCLALTVGILGCLVFGLGMALALEWAQLGWGVAVSAVGCVLMAAACPLYRAVFGRGRKKYGEEILRLSGELLGKKPEEKE